MSKMRYDISANLELVSPLHIGSGEFEADPARVPGKEGANPPAFALQVRDVNGKPVLPPTSLKGMLRSVAERVCPDGVDRLFGTIKSGSDTGQNGGTGQAGLLTVFLGEQGKAPDVAAFPYPSNHGVFIAARTKIDPKSGTANDGTLFFQEMVAPESTFTLRCRLESRDQQKLEDAKADLLLILSALRDPVGVPLGKGMADGFGRLWLKKQKVTLERKTMRADGTLKTDSKDVVLAKPSATCLTASRVTLTLNCPGPFAILDASRISKELQDRSDKKTDFKPQLSAQAGTGALPLIPGTSVAGALRARAEWLAELNRLRGAPESDSLITALFGDVGQRGQVIIDQIKVLGGTRKPMTSVKIDRFSMAPIDNALFTTSTFIGVTATLTLSLGKPDHQAFFDRLIDDLVDNGLMLGHGVNKGFGWFTVTRDGGV